MIMLAKENLSYGEKGRVAFVFGRPVCPNCVNELGESHASKPILVERFGISVRIYFGRCDECNLSCEVEQFKVGGRWFIYRWRKYSNHKKPRPGVWNKVRDLPVPAVVIGNEI